MTPRLPRLVVITDWSMGERALLAALDEVLPLGEAIAIQHRHPTATAREFLSEARVLVERCARFAVPLFVNERLDVALLVGAHLHLPARGPDLGDVRPLLPRARWISAAVHAEDEADRARGADLALVSPVFPAGSKPDDTRPPLEPNGFARLSRRLTCPAFALGGVNPERARRLPPDATAGAAVISAVLHARRPAEAAEALIASLPAQR